jgi:hypothetical protein
MWFTMGCVDSRDFDVTLVGDIRLEMDGNSLLISVGRDRERIEGFGIRFDENRQEEISSPVRREIQRANLLHLIEDWLDDDGVVLQNRAFRRSLTVVLIVDDIELGKTVQILADRAFISVKRASESAHRSNILAVLIEVVDEFPAAVSEDITSVLPTNDQDVRVPLGVEGSTELVLLEKPLTDLLALCPGRLGTGLGHTVSYHLNGNKPVGYRKRS